MASDAWVSFCAQFAEDPDPEESRCEGVGEYLASKLRQSGITVTATDLWRDVGWSIDCRIDDKQVYFFVYYYGQPPVDYILCCTSDRGLFAWLRGVKDDCQIGKLATAVHNVLKEDDRFSDVRWYPDGWFAEGNEKWVTEPRDSG